MTKRRTIMAIIIERKEMPMVVLDFDILRSYFVQSFRKTVGKLSALVSFYYKQK